MRLEDIRLAQESDTVRQHRATEAVHDTDRQLEIRVLIGNSGLSEQVVLRAF
jgi:hypothetical protein